MFIIPKPCINSSKSIVPLPSASSPKFKINKNKVYSNNYSLCSQTLNLDKDCKANPYSLFDIGCGRKVPKLSPDFINNGSQSKNPDLKTPLVASFSKQLPPKNSPLTAF